MQWFKENRLKVVSVMYVVADLLMGFAGGASLFFWNSAQHMADFFLIAASLVSVAGHAAIFIWGKGGKASASSAKNTSKTVSLWMKPFIPWHYPLDAAFLTFAGAGLLYVCSGVASGNIPLCIVGLLVASASCCGWMLPQDRKIFGFYGMQITAVLYAGASMNTLLAGWVAQNGFLYAAALVYVAVNIILYTVRKENQSAFTQAQQTGV